MWIHFLAAGFAIFSFICIISCLCQSGYLDEMYGIDFMFDNPYGNKENTDNSEDLIENGDYNEKILESSLKGSNIKETHKRFALSVKPNTNQPGRSYETDHWSDPVPWVGFATSPANSTNFMYINRKERFATKPSNSWRDMPNRGSLKIIKMPENVRDMINKTPLEVY